MTEARVHRRQFHKLTAAALSGLVAGAGSVWAADEKKDKKGKKPKVNVDPALLLTEPNACRGLNVCKGKGKGGDNACAGQGACGSVEAHSCNGQNACEGQGGCGAYPGQNTCKTKGHCAVPLKKATWETARKQFEQLRKDAGEKVGPAPKG